MFAVVKEKLHARAKAFAAGGIMDLYEAIDSRRSIRKYTEEEVSDRDVRICLKSAMEAPSARNEQPWQFLLLRDAAQREMASKASPYTGMAKKAPLVIIVCGDLRLETAPGFWPQDCAAATQNLLLAARGLNLGAVWCGIHPVQEREEYLQKAFALPKEVIPFALVCMGHTTEKFHSQDRFRPDRIHEGIWQENPHL